MNIIELKNTITKTRISVNRLSGKMEGTEKIINKWKVEQYRLPNLNSKEL